MNTASVILLTALAIAVIMATRHIITHKTYRSCPGCRSGCGSCGECGGCGERGSCGERGDCGERKNGDCGERKKALQILE